MKVKASSFFIRHYNCNYSEIAYVIGTCFTELRLFIDKFFCTVNTIFPLLCESLYGVCVKLFAEMLEFFTHAVFQLVVVSKSVSSASSVSILQVANKVKSDHAKSSPSGGWVTAVHTTAAISPLVCRVVCSLALSCRRWTWFTVLFGRNLRIRCSFATHCLVWTFATSYILHCYYGAWWRSV